MATIFTHPAIALGIFPWFSSLRHSKSILITGLVLTALPDIDVIGLRLGIDYGDMLGHRGLSHSVFFAAAFCIFLAWYFANKYKVSIAPIWIYFTASMASHGALDAMTNGGLGVAFFAPFINDRFFLPWRPIQVSTLNIAHFFQGQGISVLKTELIYIWPPALIMFAIGFIVWRK